MKTDSTWLKNVYPVSLAKRTRMTYLFFSGAMFYLKARFIVVYCQN